MKTVNVIEYKGKEYLLENRCSGEYETKETTDIVRIERQVY